MRRTYEMYAKVCLRSVSSPYACIVRLTRAHKIENVGRQMPRSRVNTIRSLCVSILSLFLLCQLGKWWAAARNTAHMYIVHTTRTDDTTGDLAASQIRRYMYLFCGDALRWVRSLEYVLNWPRRRAHEYSTFVEM